MLDVIATLTMLNVTPTLTMLDVIPIPYHARCEKTLSVEAANTSQLMERNSSTRSLNAMISVGHTNVLKHTYKANKLLNDMLDWLVCRLLFL